MMMMMMMMMFTTISRRVGDGSTAERRTRARVRAVTSERHR